MIFRKINTYFQLLSKRRSIYRAGLLVLLLSLMVPTHPLRGGNAHWVEITDHAKNGDSRDLLKIYSILKRNGAALKDGAAWKIGETILKESLKYSLDPLLVLAVIKVESGFRLTAVSTKGARGLMQIRPFVGFALAQALDLGLEPESKEIDAESLNDPSLNIRLGVYYLNDLQKSFRDIKLALTAYNWGPTEIRNRLDEEEPIPLDYANKVLSTYRTYQKQDRPIQLALTKKF